MRAQRARAQHAEVRHAGLGYVIRNGKRIAVSVVGSNGAEQEAFNPDDFRSDPGMAAAEWGTAKSQRKELEERFIGCPVWWLQSTLPLTRSASELVAALCVWRQHAITGRQAFDMPNSELRTLGIDRRCKYRMLAKLEMAGLITVRREGRKSPVVTVRTRRQKHGS
jgi:hypothetical protein